MKLSNDGLGWREELHDSLLKRILWLLFLVACCSCALACGPFFPNMMLVGGDETIFTAPVARFHDELARLQKRLKIQKPPFPVVEAVDQERKKTSEVDLADLSAALKKRGDNAETVQRIVTTYTDAREKLVRYGDARDKWVSGRTMYGADTNAPPPAFPKITVPDDLPGEFADYARGALHWHRGSMNAARGEWQTLLERPVEERHYKSTWAAFMLGRSFEDEAPAKAVTYYSLVRALAKEGFSDSLGLAAASIGWQARAHLKNHEIERAIELYLEQLALGDGTAYASLRVAARRGLETAPPVLDSLAKNPRARAVITAHVISAERGCGCCGNDERRTQALAWLEAVERAGVTDVDSAEQLALAHYRAGRFDLAQRWIQRAPDAPVSQWLQAKLLLRDGKVDAAAGILSKLARIFPLVDPTNAENAVLFESLYVEEEDSERLSLGRQVRGELGVLLLHRREYTQALDTLLRSGFWVDASYVAERVLTADELKAYVDDSWPEAAMGERVEAFPDDLLLESTQARKIRYLLARRLARLNRSQEARGYFPKEWLPKYDLFLSCVRAAFETSNPRDQRITNYFTAAFLIRSNGMEMIGTEVQPDFTCWAGNFECGPTIEERTTNATASVAGATHDELERANAHGVEPDERWHYRSYAPQLRTAGAKLRFEEKLDAAKLLPNNTDETAMTLYKLGKEAPDLQSADVVYKMLVRRCRKTELGDAADRQRWFPPFDANGKPYVTRKQKTDAPPP